MKIIKNISALLVISLLILWVILAVFRTGNNFSKIFTEEIAWINRSDEEKRQRIFGEDHNLFKLVGIKTDKSSKILLVSKDMKDFYIARYYLFPRQLFYLNDFKKLSSENYEYILSFKNPLKDQKNVVLSYKNIASLYRVKK